MHRLFLGNRDISEGSSSIEWGSSSIIHDKLEGGEFGKVVMRVQCKQHGNTA